jgi:hypothetical protein
MSVVDDMGGRRDGASWPFGCYAVMIAHARSSGRFSMVGLAVHGRRCRLQLMRAERAVFGNVAPPDL